MASLDFNQRTIQSQMPLVDFGGFFSIPTNEGSKSPAKSPS